MYLPLHDGVQKQYYAKLAVSKLCFFTVSLPLIAFICCVAWTIIFNFREANKTHCNVHNVFPSISACIGNYEPQRSIWAGAIYAHAPFRFFIIYLRWQYFKRIIRNDLGIIVNLAVFLNVVENVTLLGLTCWSSTENYHKHSNGNNNAIKMANRSNIPWNNKTGYLLSSDGSISMLAILVQNSDVPMYIVPMVMSYHEVCFKTFIGTSIFYMFFSCLLLTMYRRTPTLSRREKHSLRIKKQAFLVNIVSFSCAAYFFLRHNKQCEPYVYSMFGLSEYIVVISNIVFHLTTVYDMSRLVIYINKYGYSIE